MLTVFTVCFWLFELCFVVYVFATLNEAAQEGVRYAMVHGSDSNTCSGPTTGCTDTSGANVVAVVKTAAGLSMHAVPQSGIGVSWPESTGSKPGSLVTVSVSYTYVPFIKLPGLAPTMKLVAQGRIVY